MFLFQSSANARASGTAATGKTLSAQEFSKRVDQLYVRTEVSFREVQRSIGALDFGDRLLNKSWLEILAMGTPAGAIPTKKEMDLYASAGIYQAAFKDFQGKYNALKDAIGSKDETKVQPALSALAKSYFELAVSQARLVQKLEEYDLKGFEYVMPALEKAMDVAMVVGLATGVGAVASLGRAALAATLKQFLAKSTGKAFASAFAGSALFTALNFGSEYYSFGQLSGAMKRMDTDQAGALDELSGILKSTKKKAGEDGAQFDRLILNVDVARAELAQKLKSDPSYRLDAGRVAAYFGETFAQLVVFEMGFGFFRAAGKAALPKAKAPEPARAQAEKAQLPAPAKAIPQAQPQIARMAPEPAQKVQPLSREEMGGVWGKGPSEATAGGTVYCGMNSKLYEMMKKTGSISPMKDPLVSEIVQSAQKLGDGQHAARMIGREPSIFTTPEEGRALLYAKSSPEMLWTSMGIISQKDPALARQYMARLGKEGWLDAKPVVLEIRISDGREIGLPEGSPLDYKALRAASRPLGELPLRAALPLDRVVNANVVDAPHRLNEVKAALEPASKQFDSPKVIHDALKNQAMPPEIAEIIMGEGIQNIKVPTGESVEFATLLRNYVDRYPDVAEKNEVSDYSLRGLLKSYETWADKEGSSIVDFVRELEATKLPHELLCRSSELKLLLATEFGTDITIGVTATRFPGTGRVFEITATDGRRFVAKVDREADGSVVAREAFGHNVLRLLGVEPGYMIAVHGDLSVMEMVPGMTLFKFKKAGGLPGALAYSEIAPGATGQARTNYLSSIARIMAQQLATWTDDSHSGNFMVSWNGKAARIDIGDFSTRQSERLSALDRFMGRTIEPTAAEIKLMHDEFVSEWIGMRENFLAPGNAARIKAEYAQYWSSMPEIGKQMYETLGFYLTKMTPEQAWNLFLEGPKVSK